MAGLGISPPRSLSISPEEKKQIARRQVEETADELGMNLEGELDRVDVGDLGLYTNAVTVSSSRGTEIIFDRSNFFRKPEEDQTHTTAHELIHVKQFNNSLDKWAREEFNVSDEFARELGSNYNSAADMEGETEAILEPLFPGQKSSYPYFKTRKEREWSSKGIDVESELVQEIEDFEKEILSEYREVYSSVSGDNIYFEAGNIDGSEYMVTVYGLGAGEFGEDITESYIEELSGEGNDYDGLAEEIEKYLQAIHPRLGRYNTFSGYEVDGKGKNGFDNPVPDDIGVPSPPDSDYSQDAKAK